MASKKLRLKAAARPTLSTLAIKQSTLSLKRTAAQADDDDGASSELGDDSTFIKRSKKTGKPIRQSAGKRSLPAGYVATDVAFDLEDEDSELSSSEDEEGELEIIKIKPAKRRRTHPSTPPLSPARDLHSSGPELSSPNYHASPKSAPQESTQEMSLTFHIPPGHEGPFVVKLDLNLIKGSVKPRAELPVTPESLALSELSSGLDTSASRIRHALIGRRHSKRVQYAGFLDIAPELRNVIYRHALVTKTPIDFRSTSSSVMANFSHSGGFLLTCRQVYEEARTILYGENEFRFARDVRSRGNYFDEWRQVGWKDIRRFLTTIGSINISHLRNIHFTFENPPPRDDHNPPFVNDDYLIECLKLFARHGALETVNITFHGKITIKKADERFIHHLKAIKADNVKIAPESNAINYPYYSQWSKSQKLDKEIFRGIVKQMERTVKRYDNDD